MRTILKRVPQGCGGQVRREGPGPEIRDGSSLVCYRNDDANRLVRAVMGNAAGSGASREDLALRRNRASRAVLFVSWLIFGLSACDGIERNKPTELLLGLSSHISLNEARQRIQVAPDNWRILEDTKTSPGDKRPPYHLVVATISNVKSYGVPGEASLKFFNGRLMEISFYPVDQTSFVRRFRDETGTDLEKSGIREMSSGAQVEVATDHKGRRYIRITNPGLRKEHDSWIRHYA